MFHTRCHRFIEGTLRRDRATRRTRWSRATRIRCHIPVDELRRLQSLDPTSLSRDEPMTMPDHRTDQGRWAGGPHPDQGRPHRRRPTRRPSSAARSPATSCWARRAWRSSRPTPTASWPRSGIEIRGDEVALGLFRDAGATVDGERVRFDPGHVRALCATAPRSFTQLARNPARSVEIGGDSVVLAPAYGSPFVRDLAGGRRYALAGRLRELREAGLRRRRGCTTRAAPCASRSTCRSTSGTSTWCTPTCATATRR